MVLSAQVSGLTPGGTVSFFSGDTLLGAANLIGGIAKLTVSNLPLGSQALTAVYGGDSNNLANKSAVLSETVVRPQVGLVLTSSRTATTAVTPTTLTATFANSSPTGVVKFMNGDVELGSATIVDGQASLLVSRMPAGVNHLRAVYAGDEQNVAVVSTDVVDHVEVVATQLRAEAVTASVVYGTPFTLKAYISGDHPSGSVTFSASNYGPPLGVAQVIDGVATLTLSSTPDVGSYTITTVYSGDANNAGSVAKTFTQTVTQAPLTFTVSSSASAVRVGQSVVITASLPRSGNGYPISHVSFYDGATDLGYARVYGDGLAQINLPNLAMGTHEITAVYWGEGSNIPRTTATAPVRVDVQAAQTVRMSLEPSGGWLYQNPNTNFVMKATVAGGSTPTGMVTFVSADLWDQSKVVVLGVAPVINGEANLSVPNGIMFRNTTHTYISASYSGDGVNLPANVIKTAFVYTGGVIPGAETRATTTTSLSTATNDAQHGNDMVLTGTVSVAGGPAATGTVSFYNGNNLLGSAIVVNGVANFTTANLPVSVNNLRAIYSGDVTNAQSISDIVSETPVTKTVDLSIAMSRDVATTADSITFVTRTNDQHRDGTVKFYSDGNLIGSTSMSAGVAAWSVSGATIGALGTHQIHAVFTAPNNTAVGTSAQAQIKVNAVTTTKLEASTRTPILGASTTLTARVAGNHPGGTVSFYDNAYGNNLIGSAEVHDGVAVLVVSDIQLGARYWNAVYSGDANNASSYDLYSFWSSDAAIGKPTATVTKLKTEVTQTESGAMQTLKAVVTGVTPTGPVTFFDQYGAVLGVANLVEDEALSESIATLRIPYVEGHGGVTATYAGDAKNASSVVHLNEGVPTPSTLEVRSSNALPEQGMPVTLTATIGGNHADGLVSFFDAQGKQLGQVSSVNGVANLSLKTLPAGSNKILAVYQGDANNATSIANFVQEVAKAQTYVTLTSTHDSSGQGAPIILTAKVARNGSGFAQGSVTFYQGASIIGTADLANGLGAITVTNLPLGVNDISVRYSGDTNNQAMTSDVFKQTISPALNYTRIAFTSSHPYNATVRQGDTVTLTARVEGQAGSYPTGLVTFYENNEAVGTATLVDGVASLTRVIHKNGFVFPDRWLHWRRQK